ncbi:hypothetical protein EVAR_48131_1 [Eumeta japonica]|uniref:115 kDa protein in type-1 retrotransposable element R1DM n=1 Tax=Eumeta variegata TaxID=151549 RepID=A0A4C2A8P2_EUMVA|nr:hypothetical protein EVAR_48131_1 [Eumeta japonica]
MESPKMRKLYKGRLRGHRTWGVQLRAGSEQNGMIWLGRRWRTAAAGAPAEDRTHTAEGSSTEGCTDRVSLRFMQSNLQRSKLATTELLVEAARRKLRVVQKTAPRRGPVKAAIMVLNSDVDVEEDQTLNGENVAAAVIKAGNCRIGVVSVYFEGDMPIGPYLDRVRYVCSKLGTDKIILGGDVNAWSVWGSSPQERGGCDCVQPALLDRAEGWQVVRDVTSSDHNAVTFAVRVEGRSGPPLWYTSLQYGKGSMVRVRSSHGCCSNERTLTTEMVKSVGSCDQLDEVVETYTECIRQACDAAIPRKSSNTRGLKPPWWSPELEGLKRDARTKKRRIRNAAPGRREYVVGEMESLWDGIYRVIRETGKPGGCPIKTDSGQVIGPDESATLLAETFSLMTVSILTIRIIRKSEGEPTGVVNHPKLRGSARVDPPLPGLRLGLLLKHSTSKGPGIDGFTSDICQAAIFRDLGLFLAMANKCLELGYFPRAWKVAAIKRAPSTTRGGRRWRPSCAPWLPGEPPWPGPRLPSGPGGSRQVRWRGVQERDFKGLYTRFYSRSNLWNLILDSLPENSGNSAYTCRRSRMMWSSCSPDSRLRRSRRRPTASSSRARWGVRNKLRFAPSKTNSMVLTKS